MLTLTRSGSPARHLNGAVNRLLSDFLVELPKADRTSTTASPFLDLWEETESVHAEMDLPGYTMEDVEVFAHQDTLRIRGRRVLARPEGTRWLRQERSQGSFERTVRIPYDVAADKVQASLRAGVLHVTLPKAEHEVPRKVEVKVTSGS